MAQGDKYKIPYDYLQNDHSLLQLISRLQRAIDSVRKRTRVNPSSRVIRWKEALVYLDSADKRSVLIQMLPSLIKGQWDHPYQNSFRALVDSRMFIELVEYLLEDLSEEDLHDLVSGNFQPSKDNPSSRARDREFELFIAAICRRSGMKTVLSEPDILFELDGINYSIAAKRLRSPKRVEKNIKKAEAQIVGAGYPGFIVMDVSMILDPDSVVVTHWRTADQIVVSRLLAFTNTEHRQSLQREPNDLVRGIIIRTVFPYISQEFRYGTYEHWMAVPVSWGDGEITNRLLKRLLNGLNGI